MAEEKRLLAEVERNEALRALMAHLAKRTNEANVTTVDFIKDGLKKSDGGSIERNEAVQALRLLEGHGLGKFMTGRRGQKSRLEWSTGAVEIAKRVVPAISGDNKISSGVLTPSETESEPAMGSPVAVDRYEFRFPLRRGLEVVIALPLDLDADERQRLSTAISTLPVS